MLRESAMAFQNDWELIEHSNQNLSNASSHFPNPDKNNILDQKEKNKNNQLGYFEKVLLKRFEAILLEPLDKQDNLQCPQDKLSYNPKTNDWLSSGKGDRNEQEDVQDSIKLDDCKINDITDARQAANFLKAALGQIEYTAINPTYDGGGDVPPTKRATPRIKIDESGSTFNGCLQFNEKDPEGKSTAIGIVTANVGDSCSVLFRPDPKNTSHYKPEILSVMHKWNLLKECERAKKMGGQIDHGRLRISPDDSLAMSRSIGDYLFVGKGKIWEPDFTYVTVKPEEAKDSFIVQACDGVWDVLSPVLLTQYICYFNVEIPTDPAKYNEYWQQVTATINPTDMLNFVTIHEHYNERLSFLLDIKKHINQWIKGIDDEKRKTLTDKQIEAEIGEITKKIIAKFNSKDNKIDYKNFINEGKYAPIVNRLKALQAVLKKNINSDIPSNILNEKTNPEILKLANTILTVMIENKQPTLAADAKRKNDENWRKFHKIIHQQKKAAQGNPAEFIRRIAYLYGSTDNITCNVIPVQAGKLSYVADGHNGVGVANLIQTELPQKLQELNEPVTIIERTIEYVKEHQKKDKENYLPAEVYNTLVLALEGHKQFITDESGIAAKLYPQGVAPLLEKQKSVAPSWDSAARSGVMDAKKHHETLIEYTKEIELRVKDVLELKPTSTDGERKKKIKEVRKFEENFKGFVTSPRLRLASAMEESGLLKVSCFLVAALVGAAVGGLIAGTICTAACAMFGPGAICAGVAGFISGSAVTWALIAQGTAMAGGAALGAAYFGLLARPTNGSRNFRTLNKSLNSIVNDYQLPEPKR